MHTCPVCGYAQLEFPPEDFTICPSCGTEFGYQDTSRSHATLRQEWIAGGLQWHSRVENPPPRWNPYWQLIKANHDGDIPDAKRIVIRQVISYAAFIPMRLSAGQFFDGQKVVAFK